MTDLLKLAERCEQAAGPDRELDAMIAETIGEKHGRETGWCNSENGDYYVIDECAASYTASLDAATMLVPEGWALTLLETTDGDRRDHTGDPLANWQAALIEHKNTGYRVDQRGCWRQGFAATPALALTAAALRAREEENG